MDQYALTGKVVYDLDVWTHSIQNSQKYFLTIYGLLVTLTFDLLYSSRTCDIALNNIFSCSCVYGLTEESVKYCAEDGNWFAKSGLEWTDYTPCVDKQVRRQIRL